MRIELMERVIKFQIPHYNLTVRTENVTLRKGMPRW